MSARPLVSVIVPARDERESIDACLDSVLSQDVEGLEVIVVDNASTDGTTEVLARRAAADPRLLVLRLEHPSIPASLNAALAAARGTWLVRVDAHSTIPPGYVATAVDRLADGRWLGVGGRKRAVGSSPTGRAIACVLNSPLAVGGSSYHYATEAQLVDHVPFGCYAVDLARELGGWDEDIANNEDFEFDQRLRARGDLLLEPAMQVDWHVRETVGALFRQYRRYGTGKPVVALRHPASVRPRHLLPPALVVWLGGVAVLALRRPGWAAAALGPYALAVAASSAVIARRASPGVSRRHVPAALVAMQTGWGLGFWQGALAALRDRRQRSAGRAPERGAAPSTTARPVPPSDPAADAASGRRSAGPSAAPGAGGRPDGAQRDGAQPEAARPESGRSDGGRSDGGRSAGGGRDTRPTAPPAARPSSEPSSSVRR